MCPGAIFFLIIIIGLGFFGGWVILTRLCKRRELHTVCSAECQDRSSMKAAATWSILCAILLLWDLLSRVSGGETEARTQTGSPLGRRCGTEP